MDKPEIENPLPFEELIEFYAGWAVPEERDPTINKQEPKKEINLPKLEIDQVLKPSNFQEKKVVASTREMTKFSLEQYQLEPALEFVTLEMSPKKNSTLSKIDWVEPRIDLWESESRYYIECELPGVSVDRISIAFEKDIVVISTLPLRTPNLLKWSCERNPTNFYRRFQLPDFVDGRSYIWKLEHGVLYIYVSKSHLRPPPRMYYKLQ